MISTFEQLIPVVAPSFILIGLGFLFRLFGKVEMDSLATITMRLLTPAFVLSHLLKAQIDLEVMNSVFFSAWIIILGGGLLAYFVMRKYPGHGRGIYLPIMFMNSVNLPFPILLAAYGEVAIPYALMFYLASLLGIFTIGLVIVAGPLSMHRIAREPVIYFMGLGIYMKMNHIPVPEILTTPLLMLESATIPMVLLGLGMQLAAVKPSHIKLSLVASLCRFSAGIVLGLACVYGFQLEGIARKVVLVESVMPGAVITYLLARKYDADPSLVASTIFISTLLSLALIPIALALIE